jgi:hypothetical protein
MASSPEDATGWKISLIIGPIEGTFANEIAARIRYGALGSPAALSQHRVFRRKFRRARVREQ